MAALVNLLLLHRLRSSSPAPSPSPRPRRPRPRARTNDKITCRICLKEGSIPIFSEDKISNKAEDLQRICQLEISKDDTLPKVLCQSCNGILQSAIEFIQLAQESDKILRAKGATKNQERTYRCRRCKKDFANKDEFTEHRKSNFHLNLKIECKICNSYYTRGSIKTHMAVAHSAARPYLCDVCGKAFPLKARMHYHRARHTNNFPFKCKQCPFQARFADNLKNHMRVHTGEKPYACPHCHMRCSNKSNLNSHMRRHKTAPEMFEHNCDQCNKGFHTLTALKKHVELDHTGSMDYECPDCNKLFSSRRQVMKHTRKVHKREPVPKGHNSVYLKFVRNNTDINNTNGQSVT